MEDGPHVLSCYAPTYGASRKAKRLLSDVQDALSEIPSDEPYVMFEEFNAHIGSRAGEADAWEHIQGPHGFGEMN